MVIDKTTIEILKLIASFLTPLIILIVGIFINNKLEGAKVALSKEKEWQNWWAEKFVVACHSYNECVTTIITGLFQIKQIEEEHLSGWEKDTEEKLSEIRQSMRRLQYLDWEIQNYIQFSKKHGSDALKKAKKLFELIGKLIGTKQGDLEEIRKVQFEFNDAIRLAHGEILGITPNKALSGRS